MCSYAPYVVQKKRYPTYMHLICLIWFPKTVTRKRQNSFRPTPHPGRIRRYHFILLRHSQRSSRPSTLGRLALGFVFLSVGGFFHRRHRSGCPLTTPLRLGLRTKRTTQYQNRYIQCFHQSHIKVGQTQSNCARHTNPYRRY